MPGTVWIIVALGLLWLIVGAVISVFGARPVRPAGIADIARRSGDYARAARPHVLDLQTVEPDRLFANVLDYDQHRKHALLIRVEFAKGRLDLLAGDVRIDPDRH